MKGRPTKLTPEVVADFCAAVAIGCTLDAASVNAGITYATYRKWVIAGEKAQERHDAGEKLTREERNLIDFIEAVERARAMAKLSWQQVIDTAAQSDPAWAWKMLQVRDPDNYSMPTNKVDVTSAGEPLQVVIRYADDRDNDPPAA